MRARCRPALGRERPPSKAVARLRLGIDRGRLDPRTSAGTSWSPSKLIGGNRRPPLLDGGDDLDDITLANLVNAPARPGLPNLPAKKPSDLAAGAILRQALRYEGLQ